MTLDIRAVDKLTCENTYVKLTKGTLSESKTIYEN